MSVINREIVSDEKDYLYLYLRYILDLNSFLLNIKLLSPKNILMNFSYKI